MALYTSGTTGHPKGVLLSQANLAHFTAWYADYVQLTEQSRVLQFSSLSFDSSLIDIFPTLLQGAELIVPGDDQRRDPLQLVELIRHRQFTVDQPFEQGSRLVAADVLSHVRSPSNSALSA